MTPGLISKKVIADRLDLVERMIGEIESLPLSSFKEFMGDRRNLWTAESCLRRSIEALLDIGRHILAKGFAIGVSEYKEIALRLGELGILSSSEVELLKILGGYRNRLVHFYHEIGEEELFRICKDQLEDLRKMREAYIRWGKNHPEKMSERL
jgi:uncharacterized protein YutE (UPF0331/DUF86 family)